MKPERYRTKTRILNSIRTVFQSESLERFLSAGIRRDGFLSGLYARLAPQYYQYSKGSERSITRDGVTFRLDISDFIAHFFYFGFRDSALDNLVAQLRNNAVVLDVGANIGITSLMVANRNRDGKVFAFEPDPFNFRRLQENLALNPHLPVKAFNIGIGESEARLKLQIVNDENLGGNRINERAESNFSWIDVTTIDRFIEAEQPGSVSLVKVDVEGFELKVLKGAEGLIRNRHPHMIIEVDEENLRRQGDSAAELVSFLEKHYSSIINVENGQPVNSSTNFEGCHFDILVRKQ